jgi:LPXTG-motif cell wall-anchored protein
MDFAVNQASATGDSSTMMFVLIGVVVAALIGGFIYLIMGRAETRPINQGFRGKEGFFGGAVTGTSALPCGRASSEAEALYAMMAYKCTGAGADLKDDLRNLRNLLSKLCCFKVDLMAPQKLISASKELGFSTHQDIQPLGDLTGRCFSKTVPERDIDIQFSKWRSAGLDSIHRLCGALSLTEEETVHAEKLFMTVWNDVMDVARTNCLVKVNDMSAAGRHEAQPNLPESAMNLREYDGYY